MNTRLARRQTSRQTSLGLTLIEALMVTATAAASLGVTLPGWQDVRRAHQLESAAAQFAADAMQARSLAVALAAPVRLTVQQPEGGACYVIHTGHANDCTCDSQGRAACQGDAQALRVVGFDAAQPVRLRSNSASMLFDADRGTVTPTGTVSLSLPSGNGMNAVINIMGRVRRCTTGEPVAGYPAC
jgi:type IV fimbrial biogenesis protein FimT